MNITKFIQNLEQDQLDFIISEKINYTSTSVIDISIVMTTHDRECQTLLTLSSIEQSKTKNIEVILVDDSPVRSDSYLTKLKTFNFPLHFIQIEYTKKTWLNPCVNYNIGFQKVRGNIVLIQNSEVLHVGDIITHALQNTTPESYLSFDVCATLNFQDNLKLKDNMRVYDFINLNLHVWWYQHSLYRNENLHFLTSITRENLTKLQGFDYDYAMGIWYDDNEFIFRIKNTLKLLVTNVEHEKTGLVGIHQHHSKNASNTQTEELLNSKLHTMKLDYFKRTGKWLYLYNNQIVTITGIRPDFIRMRNIFAKLDANFNHILIHTGQHYDSLLSDVFFRELGIREPNYILDIGKHSKNHYEQLSLLSTRIIDLFHSKNITPDLVIFLGDSNSVLASISLKKEGYKICHVEAGMRSFDMRMFEEINRKICDMCSDLLFVYHHNYKKYVLSENKDAQVHVVGNTIVEICNLYKDKLFTSPKTQDFILMDIHRPENFNDKKRLMTIIEFANTSSQRYNIPVYLIGFKRTLKKIEEYSLDLKCIQVIDLLPFSEYLKMTYNCKFLISDSGTGQEEPALLNTKVVVPRDFTERPESYENNCSVCFDMSNSKQVFEWLESNFSIKTDWLGSGNTSSLVVDGIKNYLFN